MILPVPHSELYHFVFFFERAKRLLGTCWNELSLWQVQDISVIVTRLLKNEYRGRNRIVPVKKQQKAIYRFAAIPAGEPIW